MAAPDLPDGWRSEEEVRQEQRLAARRRSRAIQAALVGLILVLVISAFVWNGAAHYARGVQAFKTQNYALAATEFSAARVLGFPYRNAPSLEQEARRADVDAQNAFLKQSRARIILARLDKAGALLAVSNAGGVLTTLQAIDADAFRNALEGNGNIRDSAAALAQHLVVASRAALRNAAWSRAGRFAAALLVLDPSSQPAMALAAKAQTGQNLSVKVADARDAGRRGQWRMALRLAQAVLATQKDFPGARAVVADARQALAPKPKTKPAAATTSPSTQTTGGSGPSTPSQPPPP